MERATAMKRATVLVAGASGFVGTRLCAALVEQGHSVRAMTRRPGAYQGAGGPVHGDVRDARSLRAALRGVDAAYYLVHSLGSSNFARRDADAARAFGQAAAEAGVSRIVYLGGLGDETTQLSEHLRSRHEVEWMLGVGGVPVTALRAGVVIGRGGASWELARQLVRRVPAVLLPSWAWTHTQPIALDDAVRYLVGALHHPEMAGRAFDIGGPEAISYADMLRRTAEIMDSPTLVLPVPLLATALSPPVSWLWPSGLSVSLGLALTTDIDVRTGRALIDSMPHETVVRDNTIRELVPFEPMDYEHAARRALAEQCRAA
jgi:uncharacterized protein YbjT (DUF2867 family)